jgi:hypothetical protein
VEREAHESGLAVGFAREVLVFTVAIVGSGRRSNNGQFPTFALWTAQVSLFFDLSMEELEKLFSGLDIDELTRRQCLAPDDLNGLATLRLISPGDPIACTLSGLRFEGKVAGELGALPLEYVSPGGITISSSRSARSFLVKVR